jgi:hypothetical protein
MSCEGCIKECVESLVDRIGEPSKRPDGTYTVGKYICLVPLCKRRTQLDIVVENGVTIGTTLSSVGVCEEHGNTPNIIIVK